MDDLKINHQLFIPNIMNRYISSKAIHIPSGSRIIIEADFDKMMSKEIVNNSKTDSKMENTLKERKIRLQRLFHLHLICDFDPARAGCIISTFWCIQCKERNLFNRTEFTIIKIGFCPAKNEIHAAFNDIVLKIVGMPGTRFGLLWLSKPVNPCSFSGNGAKNNMS